MFENAKRMEYEHLDWCADISTAFLKWQRERRLEYDIDSINFDVYPTEKIKRVFAGDILLKRGAGSGAGGSREPISWADVMMVGNDEAASNGRGAFNSRPGSKKATSMGSSRPGSKKAMSMGSSQPGSRTVIVSPMSISGSQPGSMNGVGSGGYWKKIWPPDDDDDDAE